MLDTHTAQSVIDHGLSLGADFAEVFVEKSQSSTVNTLREQVQSVESGIDFGIGLRMVYGTKVLYGYTNDTSADEMMHSLRPCVPRSSRLSDHNDTSIIEIRLIAIHSNRCCLMTPLLKVGLPSF